MKELAWVRAIARKFSYTYGLDYKEVESEAYLAYAEAIQTYDSDLNDNFRMYATPCIKNRLIDYHNREAKRKAMIAVRIDLIDPEFRKILPKHSTIMIYQEDYAQTLSEDVKEVIRVVLYSPEDFSRTLPKFARGKIVQLLRDKGWSWSKVWDAIKNTKTALKQMPQDCIITINL